MSSIIFQSERLLCRRWIPDDLESLFAVYSDPEAMRWVGEGQPITRSQCEDWLTVTETNYARRGYGMFAVTERSSGHVVGFAGLVHPGGQVEPEIKYAFLRSHWGAGLASEVVPQLLTYGARTHGMRLIIATVAEENLASQHVLTKAAMVLAERRRNEDASTTLVFHWQAPGAA